MDLQEAWKKLDRDKLTKPVKGVIDIHQESKHPVQKLIKAFRYVLRFIVLFEAILIYSFISTTQPIVRLFLAALIVIYLLGFLANYRALRKIETHFILDSNFKESLQIIYESTKTSLASQRRAWVFFYPLAGTTGFVLGLSISTDVVEVMQKWTSIVGLIVTLAITTPLGYYLALKLENSGYGKYLIQLETLLAELNQAE